MLDIAEELHRWVEQGRDFAVATVVAVGGSAPRQPGAALAVDADGTAIGSVSGAAWKARSTTCANKALTDGETVLGALRLQRRGRLRRGPHLRRSHRHPPRHRYGPKTPPARWSPPRSRPRRAAGRRRSPDRVGPDSLAGPRDCRPPRRRLRRRLRRPPRTGPHGQPPRPVPTWTPAAPAPSRSASRAPTAGPRSPSWSSPRCRRPG
ncbi:XdhC family protein [Streptomyces sp. L7]